MKIKNDKNAPKKHPKLPKQKVLNHISVVRKQQNKIKNSAKIKKTQNLALNEAAYFKELGLESSETLLAKQEGSLSPFREKIPLLSSLKNALHSSDHERLKNLANRFTRHFKELKRRLTWCGLWFLGALVFGYYFCQEGLNLLATPLAKIFFSKPFQGFVYTQIGQAFSIYVYIIFLIALCLSFPFGLIQLWLFIKPALSLRDVAWIQPLFFAAPLLFFLGAWVAYRLICPMAWEFFLEFQGLKIAGFPLIFQANLADYVESILQAMLIFGLCFQMPIVLIGITRLGLISLNLWRAWRKYVFLIIVIFAAFVAPPDWISPFGLIIPLYGLYEGTLFYIEKTQKYARMK